VEDNVQVPKLLYLPAPVAFWPTKSCDEMYKFVCQYAQSPDAGIEAQDTDFVKKWFLAAGQTEPGKASAMSSTVVLRPDPVFETSTVFTQRTNNKLHRYLGHEPTVATPVAQAAAQLLATDGAL
jgi:hypothetical protein